MKDVHDNRWHRRMDESLGLRRRMKHRSLLALFSALVLSITSAIPNIVLAEPGPVSVRFTGYSVQSIYGPMMETLMAVLREEHPTWTVTSKPSNPAGGLALVAANEADFGIGSPVEAKFAALGQAPFSEPLRDKLAWLTYLTDDLMYYFLASKSWAEGNKIVSMADIAKVKPRLRMSINRKGNQTTVAPVLRLLALHGISERDIASWGGTINWVTASDGLDLMQDGKIDVFASVGLRVSSQLADAARKRPLHWLTPNSDHLNTTAKDFFLKIDRIRADDYNVPGTFAVRDLQTVSSGLALFARQDMDPLVVEQILSAWMKHADRVEALGSATANFSKILGTSPDGFDLLPVHPGTERYLKNMVTR